MTNIPILESIFSNFGDCLQKNPTQRTTWNAFYMELVKAKNPENQLPGR